MKINIMIITPDFPKISTSWLKKQITNLEKREHTNKIGNLPELRCGRLMKNNLKIKSETKSQNTRHHDVKQKYRTLNIKHKPNNDVQEHNTEGKETINLKTRLNFHRISVNRGLRTRRSCLGRLTTGPERSQVMSGRRSSMKCNVERQ